MERRLRELAGTAAGPVAAPAAVHVRRGFVSASVPVAALGEVAASPGVSFVHMAERLRCRLPSADDAGTNVAPARRRIRVDGRSQSGAGVLVGIVDVGGFDFAHPDFVDDAGCTRFVAIWDQGGTYRPPPAGFARGSELTAELLRAAQANPRGWPPHLVERQSQASAGSHGTHVASIAAGRRGLCPEALLAGVVIDVRPPDGEFEQRRWTFVDSLAIVEAVEYLNGLARRLGLPLVVNISLGTNGGPHDGANGTCRWLDAFLATPGRAICAAAGNAGQEAGRTSDDLGWLMGRIHTSGRVPARGLDADIEWVVVGDGLADVSENELELWYGAQDRMSVSVQPPGSAQWITVRPGQYVENRRLPNGTFLSVYNEIYHPVNGDNYIAVYLSPDLRPASLRAIAAGTWRVRLHGDEVRDGRFHGWIERDDPAELDRLGGLRAFRFPSFFRGRSNVDSHSISSLACAHRVIAVANVDERSARVNVSSSQGPTRDGRHKPEVAAPGTGIVAANGFDPDRRWIAMTGTSMASPHVCGVVGLMLARNPQLTAAQIQGILKRTAQPLPGADFSWRNDAGYGVVDAVAAVREAAIVGRRVEV